MGLLGKWLFKMMDSPSFTLGNILHHLGNLGWRIPKMIRNMMFLLKKVSPFCQHGVFLEIYE